MNVLFGWERETEEIIAMNIFYGKKLYQVPPIEWTFRKLDFLLQCAQHKNNNMEGLLFCMQSTFRGILKKNKLKQKINVHIPEFYKYVFEDNSVAFIRLLWK